MTFETKVWENDWEYLLLGNHLDEIIKRCNYDFKEKVLFINNVKSKKNVLKYADKKINTGVLDCYYIVDDYAKEALDFFEIRRESFNGGYYYSIAELVSIYLCKTEYLLHFSSDSYLKENLSDWINEAISIIGKRNDIIVANPSWNNKYEEVKQESLAEIENFYLGFGFSDQCYLIKTKIFQNKIYNEKHLFSERYPKYGGELFEKRVDSYMRNNNLYRITSKELSYYHKNFPNHKILKWLHRILSFNSAGNRIFKIIR